MKNSNPTDPTEFDITTGYREYGTGSDWEDIILERLAPDIVDSLTTDNLVAETHKRIANKVMGPGHVEAFVWHDKKNIEMCGEIFGRYVYKPLTSTNLDAEPFEAGAQHARALYHHDIIEDGIEEVIEEYNILPMTDTVETAKENENKPIIDNSLWGEDYVYNHFEDAAGALNLNGRWAEKDPVRFHSIPDQSESVLDLNEWAAHMTEFYACHTERNETDKPKFDEKYLEKKFQYHAWEAQKILFSHFTDRERDDPLVRHLSKEFLEAVRSHDAHEKEEQIANIDRMSGVYRAVLEEREKGISGNVVVEMDKLEKSIRSF